jgi:membrane protein YqaA with SNARE-associated domain
MIELAVHWLLGVLAVPKIGLAAVFLVSFISATLLPLGSEPLVFAVIKADPLMYWPVILVATIGNTLGGMVDYGLGYYAKTAFAKEQETVWFRWLSRFGAKAMLLAWLPGIGDPMCTVGGWLKLPFWPSVAYMAIGKFLRYVTMTSVLLYLPDGFWQWLAQLLS